MTAQNESPVIPADYLDRVADLVEERGWEKFATDPRDKVAVIQAMKLIEPVDWWLAERVLRSRLGAEVRWPAIGDTQTEVVNFLRAARPISDEELANRFGASWQHMVPFARRCAILTTEEAEELGPLYWDKWLEAFPEDLNGRPDPENQWHIAFERAYSEAQTAYVKWAGWKYPWDKPPYPFACWPAKTVVKSVSLAILATDETTPPGAYDPLLEAWRQVIDPNFT